MVLCWRSRFLSGSAPAGAAKKPVSTIADAPTVSARLSSGLINGSLRGGGCARQLGTHGGQYRAVRIFDRRQPLFKACPSIDEARPFLPADGRFLRPG